MVEFVSYSGAYPNLCSGELVLKINGEPVYLVSENGCALVMPVNTGVVCQYNLLEPSLIPIDK